jgi:hypothetical protein
MKVKYHQNQPVELPARLDAVKAALQTALEKRSQMKL